MTKTTAYELTTQRLKITSGILNRKLDELELFRAAGLHKVGRQAFA